MPRANPASAPIAVTGAAGFIGRAVVAAAVRRGHPVRALVRRSSGPWPEGVTEVVTGDLASADLSDALQGCDAVIHLAARVHVVRETQTDPLAAFRRENVEAMEHVARAAAAAGVRRFVLASSVAVFGSVLPHGTAAGDDSAKQPDRPYGRSKLEAEQQLAEIAPPLGLSWIALRPPAVFGPGAPAHFAKLMGAARRGLPLPLGAVDNRRSFIFVDNLADAFVIAAEGEAEGSFVVTDSEAVSSGELYRALCRAYGNVTRLPSLPAALVSAAARLALGRLRAESLLGSMAVDGSRFAQTFGWKPTVGFEDAVRRTVAA